MVGGLFQGANTADFSNAVTLSTVTTEPLQGIMTTQLVTNSTAFRYVRYLSPPGGWGNVAEVGFYMLRPRLNCVASGNQLQFSWPSNQPGWLLQVQTNSPDAGVGTNWVTLSGSAMTNQMDIPLSSSNQSVFFRLIYP